MSCSAYKMDRSHVASFSGAAFEKHSDMPEEMRADVKDTVANAVEKVVETGGTYDQAAKYVKEQMDKKFGPPWHCVMGEGFAYEITCESKHLMFLYLKGYIAVVIFKALAAWEEEKANAKKWNEMKYINKYINT